MFLGQGDVVAPDTVVGIGVPVQDTGPVPTAVPLTSTPAPAAAPAASGGTPWYADFANQALSVYRQVQFSNVQAKRAAQGLPPLTAAQYNAQYVPPSATVNVGLAPQTQSLMMWVLGGAAAVAVMMILTGKRKSS